MFVSGDWLITDHGNNGALPTYREGYWCEVGGYWNGWVEPLFTREVAEQVVRRQLDLFLAEPFDTAGFLMWDVDDVLYVGITLDPDVEDVEVNVERVRPGADGLYALSCSWCWYEVTVGLDGDVDDVYGEDPALANH
jgi:hypothetical protein